MPVKRRKSKMKALQLTPEAFAAFDAGDKNALRRALKLPHWHAFAAMKRGAENKRLSMRRFDEGPATSGPLR